MDRRFAELESGQAKGYVANLRILFAALGLPICINFQLNLYFFFFFGGLEKQLLFNGGEIKRRWR